jgi:hypothetical protein
MDGMELLTAVAKHAAAPGRRMGPPIMLVWRVVKGLPWRNAGLPPERRIEFRVGIHLGDLVEESDGT